MENIFQQMRFLKKNLVVTGHLNLQQMNLNKSGNLNYVKYINHVALLFLKKWDWLVLAWCNLYLVFLIWLHHLLIMKWELKINKWEGILWTHVARLQKIGLHKTSWVLISPLLLLIQVIWKLAWSITPKLISPNFRLARIFLLEMLCL